MRKVIKKIFIILNIFVVLLTLISIIVPYFNPLKFEFSYFTGLFFPLFIFFNLIFIIIWFVLIKKWIFLSFIMICLSLPFINRFYKINIFRKEHSDEGIKLMSYNVRMFNYYEWINEPGIPARIFSFIKKENPDLLCIQEFSLKYRTNEINVFDSLKKVFNYYIVKFPEKYNNKVGLALFSKFPIIKNDFFEFENSANGILTCDIWIDSIIMKVINVHLQSSNLNKADFYFIDNLFNINNINNGNGNNHIENLKSLTRRLKEAYKKRSFQVNVLKEIIENFDGKILVCGDFNDTPISYTYYQVDKLLDDAFVKAGKGSGITYIGRSPGFRIDYVFVNQKIQPLKYFIAKVKLSDHYPVLFNFK